VMSVERKSLAEKAVELSKKVDKYTIAIGAGIYVLISPAVGLALIIGSVITLLPANAIEKWLKKRKAQTS